MNNLKYISIAFIAILLIFGLSNSNADFANCMKATKHNYITKTIKIILKHNYRTKLIKIVLKHNYRIKIIKIIHN